MANRFAASDTLGFQIYNQYLNNEVARKRAEEERRKQAEQQSKARKHNAFGQLVNTVASVGGAIAGGMSGGGVPGALAGYQMGSAGSNLLMNLFPNVGGTEPDASNPYYNKPSDMQVANQTIGMGLQAYGQYNQYLGEQARANLADFTKNLLIDPNQDKAYSIQDLTDKIKGSKEYEDAKGIFGESVLSDNTVRQIARNAYDGVGQQAIKKLQMIQSSENNEAKNKMIQNWFNRYGDAYGNMLPEGMQANLELGVTEKVTDRAKGKLLPLLELQAKTAASGGEYDQTVIEELKGIDSNLGTVYDEYLKSVKGAYDTGLTQATNKLQREYAQEQLKILTSGFKDMDSDTPPELVQAFALQLAQVAPKATGMKKEQATELFNLLAEMKTIDPQNSEEFEKATQKAADNAFQSLTGKGPYDYGLDQDQAIAKVLEQFGTQNKDGRYIDAGPVGDKVIRMLVGDSPEAVQKALNRTYSAALESANTKIDNKLDIGDWFFKSLKAFAPPWFGGKGDVSESQLNRNSSNSPLLNSMRQEVPSLNGAQR